MKQLSFDHTNRTDVTAPSDDHMLIDLGERQIGTHWLKTSSEEERSGGWWAVFFIFIFVMMGIALTVSIVHRYDTGATFRPAETSADVTGYLESMRLHTEGSDADLLVLGYSMCTAIGERGSVTDVVQTTYDQGGNTLMAGITAYTAVDHLCPQYADLLADFHGVK